MRHFLTINASRPYIAGGFTFLFEPVQNRGGSWLGVLAVEEDSAASALASAGLFGVEEIEFERYDSVKKKLAGTRNGTNGSQRPQRVPTPRGAAAVRLVEQPAGARGVGNPLIPRPAAAPAPVETVTLQSTSAEPPVEPLLEMPSMKSDRRYAAKTKVT